MSPLTPHPPGVREGGSHPFGGLEFRSFKRHPCPSQLTAPMCTPWPRNPTGPDVGSRGNRPRVSTFQILGAHKVHVTTDTLCAHWSPFCPKYNKKPQKGDQCAHKVRVFTRTLCASAAMRLGLSTAVEGLDSVTCSRPTVCGCQGACHDMHLVCTLVTFSRCERQVQITHRIPLGLAARLSRSAFARLNVPLANLETLTARLLVVPPIEVRAAPVFGMINFIK